MDSWNLMLFALVMTGAGFTQSCIGFGYAAVAMSFLPYFMDVRLGNLSVSLSAIAPMVIAIWWYRKQLDWTNLSWTLLGALLMMPVGLLAFAYLPADILVRGTGLAILLILLQQKPTKGFPQLSASMRFGCARAGAISGFLAGAVGIGGPPIAAFAYRQPWDPRRFKVFVLAFLLAESLIKVAGVAAVGWVDRKVLVHTAVAIPFALAGGQLGILMAKRMHPDRFRRVVLVMLVFASLGMIVRGS